MFKRRQDHVLEQTHGKFMRERVRVLAQRFPGWYRGVVVETNDPLGLRRTRIKIPELYNNGVKTEDVMWCVPAEWMGGRGAGSFTHPMIDDIVYVSFEKQHPYGPIWTSAADPTRRRPYSLWSVYTPSPAPISEDGEAETPPQDHLKEYLPQDGRPMSTGWQDRYGNFLVMSSVGFFPKSHDVAPAPVGTDALAMRDFEVNKNPPKSNDPDGKFFVRGTKYGHMGIMADQGYLWEEEFQGDFDSDTSFEEDRIKYYIRYFNENEPKERDQRRLEYRTRAGHKIEARDVGWETTRDGEFQSPKKIADSKGRDERWIKFTSKGGHVFSLIDIGFDPDNDQRYKQLNKSEMGDNTNGEKEMGTSQGDDARQLRAITRHGGQFVADDIGSHPRTAGTSKTPYGNGLMYRTRKGFQCQMIDQPELDHIMFATPLDQCFEMSDRWQHIILSTTQAGPLHTEIDGDATRTRTRYILKTGLTNDPEANTHHLKLDKQNDYSRLKTPDGAGIEMRGKNAPCGQWTEMRDQENRAVWLSSTDQWLMIRGKKGQKFILLDDNDDVILIRNEIGKIQIRAKDKIEIKCDEGNICLEAPNGQIGMTAKTIEMKTDGSTHKIDSSGIGTTGKVQGATLAGMHPELMAGPGGGGNAPKSGNPCTIDDKTIIRKKPLDFDKERGCDTQKNQKGEVPSGTMTRPPGGGGSGSLTPFPMDSPQVAPPSPSPFAPPPNPTMSPPPTIQPDPIAESNNGNGVLWYGVTNKFRTEIETVGLVLDSLTNHLNTPGNSESDRIPLARTLQFARKEQQALLSQRRYGDVQLILRIRNVDDPDLLGTPEDTDDIVFYQGNLSFDNNIEIFEVGEVLVSTPPEFPDVG